MATKEAQINLRLPADLDAWLADRAGGSRKKPAFIRSLLERERSREEDAELQEMFDHAWEKLSPEEREAERQAREDWVGARPGSRIVTPYRARPEAADVPTALRGEIWEVDLDPRKGREQAGIRPCLVVSTDGMNRSKFGTVIICPITTTHRESFTWRPGLVPGDLRIADASWQAVPHWVATDQIIAIDRAQRLLRHLATVTNPDRIREINSWLRRLILPSED